MNGVHDMGGMHGFGRVVPEPNEPPFHERWEGRCLALNRAMGVAGVWNIDRSRAAIEELPPHVYLRVSYYERWAMRLQNLLLECGLVDDDEILAGHARRPGRRSVQPLLPADVDRSLVRGRYDRQASTAPRFAIGERVRARNIHPLAHTRLPRYARGHVGVVEHLRGCHVFPDSAAVSGDEDPQWLYTVVFEGRELWGDDCDPKLTVSIDAFEPYLEPTPSVRPA
jgi:nitrile hydratase